MAKGPESRYVSFPCTGTLNEIASPSVVGGSALTACKNLTYHRQGAWGKRTGSSQNQINFGTYPTNPSPVSGFRWYRAYPQPLTKLVVYAQGTLMIGNDHFSLEPIGSFALSGSTAPSFCSMRDPQANYSIKGGADVLIIAGLVQPHGSFGTGQIVISGLPSPAPTSSWQIKVQNGSDSPIYTTKYYTLATDNPASIANALVTLLNQTPAFLNMNGMGFPNPFLGESYYTVQNLPYGATNSSTGAPQPGAATPTATIFLGALDSGAGSGGKGGNNITYTVLFNGADITVSPANGVTTNFTGAGGTWSGPMIYDEKTGKLRGLSYMAPNAFTQCVTWHDHVWFWGDPANPDTVFASDIYQPEAFTFMIENGGMTSEHHGGFNGGYNIGQGDGDPVVQSCLPLGNALYIFKTSNIYMIEGYDFQQGEYQFSVTPQVAGYGMPTPYCGAVLENEIVFWSGRKFLRLASGSYTPEHIGFPIPITEGLVSKGMQLDVRCVAGDLQVKTPMNNQYGPTNPYAGNTIIYRSLAMWAVDIGDGSPDTIIVYDDEATNNVGQYAWSTWTGWDVGCWIQQGAGPGNGGDIDKPYVFFVDPYGIYINLVGGNANFDFGTTQPIPWFAQTGWINFSSPELLKNARVMFANMEAQAGAQLTATIIPGRIVDAAPNWPSTFGTNPQTVAFQPTLAPANSEANNDMEQYIFNPNLTGAQPIQSKSVLMQFAEPGTSGAGFEMLSYGFDIKPEEALAT